MTWPAHEAKFSKLVWVKHLVFFPLRILEGSLALYVMFYC